MTRPAHVVAVDLGGTTIKAARYNPHGTAEEILRLPTPSPNRPDAVVAAVVQAATALVRPGVRAVGLCAPGLIDTDAGIIRFAANLGLRNTPLAAAVADAVRLPVTLEHDVRAACLAERQLGLGAGVSNLLVVVLGTGLAAAIVSDGRLIHGATGIAGEFGHIPVHPDGELCACGQRGCAEAYAAAGALVRRYRRTGNTADTAADITARLDTEAAAARIWAEATDALGRALVTSTVLLDHERIVLAGGMTAAGDRLTGPVRRSLQQGLAWRTAPAVEISPLGADAGLLGAALHALTATGAAPAREACRNSPAQAQTPRTA
ncbi:ROK family protein [Streptomyces sp. ISL-1]|uniref:ROK family protein n=1 Tax=Streptomyces sp. ISL-1 TaxID=2817657 RepID=UPI001BEC6035|nr:ROK family protein [Streptomyces sp. ISL-1]MBT2393955.1 ROK family protein [Streptomyces sp. ISL-1]